MKKVALVFCTCIFTLSSLSAKPSSWFGKKASWKKSSTWYTMETSWYSAQYHWAEGVVIDKDAEKFIINADEWLSELTSVSDTVKRERIGRLYSSALKKFGVGVSVVAVEVLLACTGGPAVSAIALCALKGSAVTGLSSSAAASVSSAVYSCIQGKSDEDVFASAIEGGAGGFMVGIILGGVAGGTSEYRQIRTASSGGLSMDEAAVMMKETGWPVDVIQKFSNREQYEICKRAGLKYDVVGGRNALVRSDINLNLTDEYGRTNLQRMESGLAPLDLNGNPFELHHIGQNMDSPLAVLKFEEHRSRGIDGIWHVTENAFRSSIDRGEFGNERAAFWKSFAKMVK